ncbi:hypothetical protein NPS01_41090 [Nocardioides psychrotolerans]|uniref:Membrane protein involved in the export of O-antigen and teichoic acid n=1 Tax=Nocardioides psychrotolerans TaxID=1005945 RepID=A0A1I3N6P2_9ACTN|nr:hypothetical protein NPS01_41090 [Nocardioides psychrotolerans]SFJ04720.1 Membrane protein involved in the export of O-antigen and teichoic acid [Nocardioides psychrotolerans]
MAAAQKASGFILLVAFTRVLSPSDYGQVALLTAVGSLLVMFLTLGLEPRITYAYFRAGDELADYLRVARRVTFYVPLVLAASLAAVLALVPIPLQGAWILQCVGSCLLAAGTTYAYAVLRASRQVVPYATLALTILATQVGTRVLMVAVLQWGPTGWAAGDLVAGLVAIAVSQLALRRLHTPGSRNPKYTAWSVTREGLPLVPHYLAQWGLSLSDRLILAMFVSSALVGVYSAIYQIAAVTSLVLNEVSRAFMPLYAKNPPGSAHIPRIVRSHLKVSFVVHGVFLVAGFAAIEVILPPAFRSHDEIFPLLSLGALAYGLYFIPMNGLTLISGITSRAPVISLTALTLNVGLNLTLNSIWGLWGAVVGTALGYSTLAGTALWFEARTRAIPWQDLLRRQPWTNSAYLLLVSATLAATWPGTIRVVALSTVSCVVVALAVSTLRDERRRLRFAR